MNKGLLGLLFSIALIQVGCGQNFDGEQFKSIQNEADRRQAADDAGQAVEDDINDSIDAGDVDISASEKLAEDAANEANSTLDEVTELTESKLGVDGIQSPDQLDDVKKLLEGKFGKIAGIILKVKEKIQDGRDKVNEQLTYLNPAIPAHQSAIAKLERLLSKLDEMEAKIDGSVGLLVGKLDIVDQLFDKLIAKLDPTNLFHFVLIYKINELRQKVITKLKEKLYGL